MNTVPVRWCREC